MDWVSELLMYERPSSVFLKTAWLFVYSTLEEFWEILNVESTFCFKREIETIGSKGFCGTERVVTGLDRKPLEALNLRKHWLSAPQSQLKGWGKLTLAVWAQHGTTASTSTKSVLAGFTPSSKQMGGCAGITLFLPGRLADTVHASFCWSFQTKYFCTEHTLGSFTMRKRKVRKLA